MQAPPVVSAKPKWVYGLGDHLGIFFVDNVAMGPVTYSYVLTVGPRSGGTISFYITSEKNMMYGLMPKTGGSHNLCVFDGTGHRNLGASNDWADPDKFEARALDMACERLGFPRERVCRASPRAAERTPVEHTRLRSFLDN
jgi:hypothetical protein